MNLLAHLHLGERLTPPEAAGNLTADYCSDAGSPGYRRGIHIHRSIDAYTDSHPAVAEARRIFTGGFRRFGGVLTDLAFDLCLSRTWDEWEDTPALAQFIDIRLGAITRQAWGIPADSAMILSRMFGDRWLHEYQDIAGLRGVINRIVRRRPVALSMMGGDRVIESHLTEFIQIFRVFYPQLMLHTEALLSRREDAMMRRTGSQNGFSSH